MLPVHAASSTDQFPTGVVSCADLAAVPALGRCPAGAATVRIEPGLAGSRFMPRAWPASDLRPDQLAALPMDSVAVATDGSATAIERARTVLETGLTVPAPGFGPETITESNADHAGELFRRYLDCLGPLGRGDAAAADRIGGPAAVASAGERPPGRRRHVRPPSAASDGAASDGPFRHRAVS